MNTPISGRLESVIGHTELEATPDYAVIYPPGTPACLRHWSASLSSAINTAFVLAALPDVDDAHPATRPRIVKRVLDEMHDDPCRSWTAGDMAEVAGVSIRRLQEGFRDYVGASPRECLTDIRLTRVREDLLRGGDGFTVTDIAMRWGLVHGGRFAAAYRRKYGESPSETLRANRQI